MPATVSGPGFDWQLCTGTDVASCAGPVVGGTNATFTPMDDDVFEGRYLRAVGDRRSSRTRRAHVTGPDRGRPARSGSRHRHGRCGGGSNAATVTVVGSGSGYGAGWSGSSSPLRSPHRSPATNRPPGHRRRTLGFRLTVTTSGQRRDDRHRDHVRHTCRRRAVPAGGRGRHTGPQGARSRLPITIRYTSTPRPGVVGGHDRAGDVSAWGVTLAVSISDSRSPIEGGAGCRHVRQRRPGDPGGRR